MIRTMDENTAPQAMQTLRQNSETKPKEHKKWRLILEPALMGAMMAVNLGQTSLQNLYLRTACTVDLNYPMEICDRGVGEEFRAAEAASQKVVSQINISRSFVGSLICSIILLSLGPWSDCSGRRKPLLILPLVGMSVVTTGVLLMLIFPGASTAQILYVVQIPISLSGNFGLLTTAAFSHIGDLCHETGIDVTQTMGTHRAAVQIAHIVGSVSGPLLYRHLGFFGVFPLVLLLQLFSLLYVLVVMKDVNVNKENQVSLLNWRLPLNALQCLLRPREGRRRLVILLMLVVALGDRIVLSAGALLSYMYYRYKFEWDDVLYGSFLAYKNIASFCGTLLILTVLKRRLQLSDEVVGVLSCWSAIVSFAGLIAANTTVVVFILPLVGIMAQGSQMVRRPIVNRQIAPNEQGKIYSVMCALESATQTLSSPLYSLLYSKTVSTFPDAWLIPGIVLAVIQSLSYLLTRTLVNKPTDKQTSQPAHANNTDCEEKPDPNNIVETNDSHLNTKI